MFKKAKIKLIFSLLLLVFGSFLLGVSALALETGIDYGTLTGLGTQDIRVTIMQVIRIILGLVGIIALAIIIYGGWMWMTSAGNAERIATAKKILVNAVIGLVIIFTSFAISSFIINALIKATGAGGGGGVGFSCTPNVCYSCGYRCNSAGDGVSSDLTCVGPFLCGPGAACPKPLTPEPTICKVEAVRGVDSFNTPQGYVGDYVSIWGWYFEPYSPPNSKVEFDTTTAEVVQCSGSNIWKNDPTEPAYFEVRVEVPALTVNENYDVTITTASSLQSDPKLFRIIPGSGPALACIEPILGVKNEELIKAEGARFGPEPNPLELTQGLIFQNLQRALLGALGSGWTDDLIDKPIVPNNAVSGWTEVVDVTGTDSNDIWFTVTCVDNADCSSNCCSGFSCRPPEFCFPGLGESCDADLGTPACEIGVCQPGLTCDSAAGCTCQLPGPGANCNLGAGPVCDPGQCQPDLVCNASGSCVCDFVPIIDYVTPGDGALANMITIGGRYFGATAGIVYFSDAAGQPTIWADLAEDLNLDCSPSWSDEQIIVLVPPGFDGPIKVERNTALNGTSDTTNNNRGPILADFDVNSIVRPGLCRIDPVTGVLDTPILSLSGIGFNSGSNQVFFGAVLANGAANVINQTLIKDVRVPAVDPGVVGVTVLDTSTGQGSNPLNFEVTDIGINPIIFDFSPTSGAEATYITISGANFGPSKAPSSHVYFVNVTDTEAEYDFPLECSSTFWTNSQIIVKVPDGLANGDYLIRVETAVGSDATDDLVPSEFVVDSSVIRPNICKLIPDNGPVGSNVYVYGDNFLNPNVNQVNFFDNVPQAPALVQNQTLQTSVPTGAISGPLAAENILGNQSNNLNFLVGTCSTNSCGASEECCSAGVFSGSCMPAGGCVGTPEASTYTWFFSTQSFGPKVVENCNRTGACHQTLNISSPSPYSQQGTIDGNFLVGAHRPDDGAVPIDAVISAMINQKMNISTLNTDTIKIDRCNEATQILVVGGEPQVVELPFDNGSCSPATVTAVVTTFDCNYLNPEDPDAICFDLEPTTLLDKNYWYKVTLLSPQIFGTNGETLNSNDIVGGSGNYSWVFKTRNSDDVGQVSCVVVSPARQRSVKVNDIRQWHAQAQDQDFVCVNLNPATSCSPGVNSGWNWLTSDSTKAEIVLPFNKNNADTISYAEQIDPPVGVIAQCTVPDGLVSGQGDLVIDLSSPYVIDHFPNCGSACLNSLVGATFNLEMTDGTGLGSVYEALDLYSCFGEPNCDASSDNRVDYFVKPEVLNTAEANYTYTGYLDCFDYNGDGTDDYCLLPDTYYRVVIRDSAISKETQKNLVGLNYIDQTYTAKLGVINSYSWVFKTQPSFGLCLPDKIDVIPPDINPPVGIELLYASRPLVSTRECQNQRLNPYSVDWLWDVNPADGTADLRTDAGLLNANGGNLRDSCGNKVVEQGEDCDDGNLVSGDGCSGPDPVNGSCLTEGDPDTGNTNNWDVCGNGIIERSEMCEYPGSPGCSVNIPGTPGSGCKLTGSVVGNSVCGNGIIELGEQCDDGQLTPHCFGQLVSCVPGDPSACGGVPANCVNTPQSDDGCSGNIPSEWLPGITGACLVENFGASFCRSVNNNKFDFNRSCIGQGDCADPSQERCVALNTLSSFANQTAGPVCGNLLVEAGEECDLGGVCSDNGEPCTTSNLSMCDNPFDPGVTCEIVASAACTAQCINAGSVMEFDDPPDVGPYQLALTLNDGETYVEAEVFGFNQAEGGPLGLGHLLVGNGGFVGDGPQIIERYPECATACINAEIGAQFDRSMNVQVGGFNSILNTNNIFLYECGTDRNCDQTKATKIEQIKLAPEDFVVANDGVTITLPPGYNRIDSNQDGVIDEKDRSALLPNTTYRVVIRGSVVSASPALNLVGLNYDDPTLNPLAGIDSVSWKFTTQDTFELCSIGSIKVLPDGLTLPQDVLQRYKASPRAEPDSCDPIAGQRLDPYFYDWRWEAAHCSVETDPKSYVCDDPTAVVGAFLVRDAAGNLRDGCGNWAVEGGEDCDDGNLDSGDGCNSVCQNEGTSICSTSTGGENFVDAGIGYISTTQEVLANGLPASFKPAVGYYDPFGDPGLDGPRVVVWDSSGVGYYATSSKKWFRLDSTTGPSGILPTGFIPRVGYAQEMSGSEVLELWDATGDRYTYSEPSGWFHQPRPTGAAGDLPSNFVPVLGYYHAVNGAGSKRISLWDRNGRAFVQELPTFEWISIDPTDFDWPEDFKPVVGYWNLLGGGNGKVEIWDAQGERWEVTIGDAINTTADKVADGLPADFVPNVGYYHPFGGVPGRVSLWGDPIVNNCCGNGSIEVGEDCDEGDFNPANPFFGDYCTEQCLLVGNTNYTPTVGVNKNNYQSIGVCGNGIIDINEECDTGNEPNGNSADGCSDICLLTGSVPGTNSVCGDGQVGEGEQCDDGQLTKFYCSDDFVPCDPTDPNRCGGELHRCINTPKSADGCSGFIIDINGNVLENECTNIDFDPALPDENYYAICHWTGNNCQTRPCLLENRNVDVCRSTANNRFDFNQDPLDCSSDFDPVNLLGVTGNANWNIPICGNGEVEIGEECDLGINSMDLIDSCDDSCLNSGSIADDGFIDPYQIVHTATTTTILTEVREEIRAWHNLKPNVVGVAELTVTTNAKTPFAIIGHQPPLPPSDPQCRNVAIWATFTQALDINTIKDNIWLCQGSCNTINDNLIKSTSYRSIIGECVQNKCNYPFADPANTPFANSFCQTDYDCTGGQIIVDSLNTPSGFLAANTSYKIVVDPIKLLSADGENLKSSCSGNACTWDFETNADFCQCDYVAVGINPTSGGAQATRDLFTCSGDTCGGLTPLNPLDDDANFLPPPPAPPVLAPGNQHLYAATCYDINNPSNIAIPLITTGLQYNWTEYDPDNTVYLSDNPVVSNVSCIDGNYECYITPGDDAGTPDNAKNGNADVLVTAYQYHCSNSIGMLCVPGGICPGNETCVPGLADQRTVNVTTFICNNPWPDVGLYLDQANNCAGGNCPNANFEFIYCQDQGATTFDDDLPSLVKPNVIPKAEGIINGRGNVVKEFIFPVCQDQFECTNSTSAEAVAIRVLKNPLHLSPQTWYRSGFCGGQADISKLCFNNNECSAEELLKNPSFDEVGAVGPLTLTNSAVALGDNFWFGQSATAVGNTISYRAESARSGNFGAWLNAPNDPGNWGSQIFSNLTLPAGVYSFSSYVRSDDEIRVAAQLNGNLNTSGICSVGSQACPIKGAACGASGICEADWSGICENPTCDYISTGLHAGKGLSCSNQTGDWEKVTCNFTLSEQKAIQFIVRVPNIGATDIDDASLQAGSCSLNVPNPGNPQSLVVDGYEAVRDGRSVYVGATNQDGSNLFSNIYLISYDEKDNNSKTSEIADRILDKNEQLGFWNFNTNKINYRVCNNYGYYSDTQDLCSNLGTSNFGICGDDSHSTPDSCNADKLNGCYWSTSFNGCLARVCEPIYCQSDFECPNLSCNIEKEKIVRDAKRYGDLRDIQLELGEYFDNTNSYPNLGGGTYIASTTFSVWPSWQQTFANNLSTSLDVDPINKLIGCGDYYCDTNENGTIDGGEYTPGDPTFNACGLTDPVRCDRNPRLCLPLDPDQIITCWDEVEQEFACPAGMLTYAYRNAALGNAYELYTTMEYTGDGRWGSATPYHLPLSNVAGGAICPIPNFEINLQTHVSVGTPAPAICSDKRCYGPSMQPSLVGYRCGSINDCQTKCATNNVATPGSCPPDSNLFCTGDADLDGFCDYPNF